MVTDRDEESTEHRVEIIKAGYTMHAVSVGPAKSVCHNTLDQCQCTTLGCCVYVEESDEDSDEDASDFDDHKSDHDVQQPQVPDPPSSARAPTCSCPFMPAVSERVMTNLGMSISYEHFATATTGDEFDERMLALVALAHKQQAARLYSTAEIKDRLYLTSHDRKPDSVSWMAVDVRMPQGLTNYFQQSLPPEQRQALVQDVNGCAARYCERTLGTDEAPFNRVDQDGYVGPWWMYMQPPEGTSGTYDDLLACRREHPEGLKDMWLSDDRGIPGPVHVETNDCRTLIKQFEGYQIVFLVDRRYLSFYYAITGHSLYDKCARDEWPLPFTFTPTVLLDLGIPLKAIMLGPGACAWVDGLHFVFKSLEYGSLSGAVGVGTLIEWFLVIRRRLLDPERHIDNHTMWFTAAPANSMWGVYMAIRAGTFSDPNAVQHDLHRLAAVMLELADYDKALGEPARLTGFPWHGAIDQSILDLRALKLMAFDLTTHLSETPVVPWCDDNCCLTQPMHCYLAARAVLESRGVVLSPPPPDRSWEALVHAYTEALGSTKQAAGKFNQLARKLFSKWRHQPPRGVHACTEGTSARDAKDPTWGNFNTVTMFANTGLGPHIRTLAQYTCSACGRVTSDCDQTFWTALGAEIGDINDAFDRQEQPGSLQRCGNDTCPPGSLARKIIRMPNVLVVMTGGVPGSGKLTHVPPSMMFKDADYTHACTLFNFDDRHFTEETSAGDGHFIYTDGRTHTHARAS